MMRSAVRNGSYQQRPSARVRDDYADELPPPDLGDVPVAPRGPVVACMTCGEEPGGASDCAHLEVLRVADATPALREAIATLKSLARERRSHDRALRRLVGEGDIERATAVVNVPSPPVAPPVALDASDASGARCPRCGREGDCAPTPKRRRRTAGTEETQCVLGFARVLSDDETP